MSHVVLAHEHDVDQHVYRLIIGIPVYEDQPAFEDYPVFTDVPVDPEDPEAGTEQVLTGTEQVLTGSEQVLVGHVDVRDFVFADDDERWQGLTDEAIAELQRGMVSEALTPPAAERAVEARSLPGAGEPLV